MKSPEALVARAIKCPTCPSGTTPFPHHDKSGIYFCANPKQEVIDALETELAAKRKRVDAAMRCLAEATAATPDDMDMWQELAHEVLHGDDAAVASIFTQPEPHQTRRPPRRRRRRNTHNGNGRGVADGR